MFALLRTERMQLRNHRHRTSETFPSLKGLCDIYIYCIKYGILEVCENEISLRKWPPGTAQLCTFEVTLVTSNCWNDLQSESHKIHSPNPTKIHSPKFTVRNSQSHKIHSPNPTKIHSPDSQSESHKIRYSPVQSKSSTMLIPAGTYQKAENWFVTVYFKTYWIPCVFNESDRGLGTERKEFL